MFIEDTMEILFGQNKVFECTVPENFTNYCNL